MLLTGGRRSLLWPRAAKYVKLFSYVCVYGLINKVTVPKGTRLSRVRIEFPRNCDFGDEVKQLQWKSVPKNFRTQESGLSYYYLLYLCN